MSEQERVRLPRNHLLRRVTRFAGSVTGTALGLLFLHWLGMPDTRGLIAAAALSTGVGLCSMFIEWCISGTITGSDPIP